MIFISLTGGVWFVAYTWWNHLWVSSGAAYMRSWQDI